VVRFASVDDRGHPVRVGPFPPLSPGPLPGRPAASLLLAVRSRAGSLGLINAFVLTALVALAYSAGPFAIAVALFAPVAATITIFAVAFVLSLRDLPHRYVCYVRAAALGRGRCPACAYPICALEPAADGCTVCPECGGAWDRAEPPPVERVVIHGFERPPVAV
jgi:hypothetical protein